MKLLGFFSVYKRLKNMKNQVATILIAARENSAPVWTNELYYCVNQCGHTCWVADERTGAELGSLLSYLSKSAQGNLRPFGLFAWTAFLFSYTQWPLLKSIIALQICLSTDCMGWDLIRHLSLHSLCYSTKIMLMVNIFSLKIGIISVF